MRPLEAQEVNAYLGLFADNAISHQTLLEELQRGHVLSSDIDLEEELARIEEEKKAAMEEAMSQAQAMAELSGPEEFAPKPGAPAEKDPSAKKDGKDPQKEQAAKAGNTAPKGAAAAASALKNTPVKKAQKK